MRASTVVVDLVSAVILLGCLLCSVAQEDNLWHRIRRGLNNVGVGRRDAPYHLYGGPTPEDIAYTYPPYGYPPPGPTSSNTISSALTSSTGV